jgi:hypothetical protein
MHNTAACVGVRLPLVRVELRFHLHRRVVPDLPGLTGSNGVPTRNCPAYSLPPRSGHDNLRVPGKQPHQVTGRGMSALVGKQPKTQEHGTANSQVLAGMDTRTLNHGRECPPLAIPAAPRYISALNFRAVLIM